MTMAQNKYTSVAIWLHWILAILILGQIAGGLLTEDVESKVLKFELVQWHKSFGMLVLALSFFRLYWRFAHKPPAPPAAMSGPEKMVVKIMHVLFYVLMIGIPLVGWMVSSASPKDIDLTLFKIIPWPHLPFIPKSENSVEILKEVHEYLSFAMLGLFALHVVAALKHHYINKDDVLTRMVTFMKPKG
jgi:cytochrome b561